MLRIPIIVDPPLRSSPYSSRGCSSMCTLKSVCIWNAGAQPGNDAGGDRAADSWQGSS